ncbi:MAG: glycosyltransferase family 39 protein [Chloroflexi bacterium]|nr:glycosyltransferase family 39 protein [Chloroflexota bacterium]
MTQRAIGVFLFTFAIYCFSIGTPFYSSDAQVMYATARSLAVDGDLTLDDHSLPQIVPGRDGQYFSKYDPGLPLLAVPIIYYADRVAATHRANRYATAALFVMVIPALAMSAASMGLFLIAVQLYPQSRALAVTLTAAFATIMFPYARLFFAESVLTACLTLAVWGVWCERTWLASLMLGLGILTRASFVIYMPVLLWLAWHTVPRWKLAPLLTAVILAGVGLLYHNYLRFGSLWETGYEGEGGFTGSGWLSLLLSPGKSIFLYSPPLLISVVLWYRFRREYRLLADSFLFMFVAALGVYGAWWAWHGGWVWGPRLLVPLVPLCCLPLGMMPIRRRWILVAITVVTLGVVVQIIGTFTNVVPHYSAVFQNAHPDSPQKYAEIHWQNPLLWAGLERARNGQWESISLLHLRDLGLPPHWADRTPIAIVVLGLFGVFLIAASRSE